MNKLGLQVSVKFPQAYTLGPQSPKKLLQTDVFSFFRIISVVHLLFQPVAMPDLRENTLLLKWRQLSEINENIWKAIRASLLFERHFSFGSPCNIKERNCAAVLHMTSPSLVLLEKNTCFDIWVLQRMLPSTSCACSFGEKSSVSVGAAPCFASDHSEETELERSALIWSWVGCAGREQLGRRSIFHSKHFVWNIWEELGATFSSGWAGTWEHVLRFMQDREFGLKPFFFGVLVLLPSSCDLVLLWPTSDGCHQDSQKVVDSVD